MIKDVKEIVVGLVPPGIFAVVTALDIDLAVKISVGVATFIFLATKTIRMWRGKGDE